MKEVSAVNQRVITLLKKIDHFNDFTSADINSLLDLGRLREYKPGDVIIKEGDYDCWVYFLLSGGLEIVKDGQRVGLMHRAGDLVGEMGVIDGSPRSATIQAVKPSMLLGIDASIVDRQVKTGHLAFCYTIYRLFAEVLAARLRITTQENIALNKKLQQLEAAAPRRA